MSIDFWKLYLYSLMGVLCVKWYCKGICHDQNIDLIPKHKLINVGYLQTYFRYMINKPWTRKNDVKSNPTRNPTNGAKARSDESARQRRVSVWRTEPKFAPKSPAGLLQNVEEPTAELSTEQRASLPDKRTVGDDWERERRVIRGTTLLRCEVNKELQKCLWVKSSNLFLFTSRGLESTADWHQMRNQIR